MRVKNTKIEENAVQEGTFGFVGVDDHYFLTAAVPLGQPLHVQYRPLVVPVPGGDEKAAAHFVEWSARYPAAPQAARFFFGPKDFDVLVAVDRDLVRSIDFGMFAWIVVPLLRALKWVNGYIGNYGWSIIALTVLINLAMFPLRHKSVVSMRRMQEIQPEVKAIQDRYAKLKMSDPAQQKMNVELMNLYRERGVNPASGCVPMLLTLPVLFAFYSMLSVAIELRGAPFIWWIKDLSVHDPYFITPVLMGISQFVQTKMTPSTADPMQQKMMMFMPLIMMTFFIWAPSGLVLYWLVSNVWAIGQQAFTNRLIGPTAQRVVRPPAERRVKNAGGRQIRPGFEGAEPVTTALHERVKEFVRQTVHAMGLPLEVSVLDTPDNVRVELSGEGGEDLLRRKGEALDALQQIVNTEVPAGARRRSIVRRRLSRLPQGEGRGSEADGALLHGEGEDQRRAAGDGPAQSVRAPPRSHHRRRGSPDVVGEHRRRVLEDGHHFGPTVSGLTSGFRSCVERFAGTSRPDVYGSGC